MIYLLINVLFFTVLAFVMNRKNINYDFKLILKKHLGKIIAVSCIVIFIVLGTIINKILNNPVVGYCIALMPAFLPYLVYDLVKSATFKKEQQGITSLLMVLTKWSSVRNDVVYCLQKTDETKLSEPIGGYIKEMCIRLEKGMSVSEALSACQENALSEELRYVLINIRYAYEKGGKSPSIRSLKIVPSGISVMHILLSSIVKVEVIPYTCTFFTSPAFICSPFKNSL
jgi:Flp pilus assembly protein TadB